MELLPKEIEAKIPGLYAQDGKGVDAVAYVKFFTPDSNWTWYVMEYDPQEQICFGLVDGFEKELGYFSLIEMKQIKGVLGLDVERDLSFKPTALRDLGLDYGN